ncbi:MAG: hypothetical protein OEZ59_08910 [Deltaproteobacteria bacterium]|nr:hypothetical protein [Deltaproteobacteria bacterium]
MIIRRLRLVLPVLLLGMLVIVAMPPHSTAQGPGSTPISLYSIWVRLSLRGYHQGEIESLMRNMDAKTMNEVKARLREMVLANLEQKDIRNRYLSSRDVDDLRTVRSSIETEIRFAGLQTDSLLKEMIADRFGIPLERL